MNHDQTTSSPGVIWVTGYPCSGKTTVARRVHYALQAQGIHTVHLDGDDLRSIFAGRWGYDHADRIELARVYFRLCSHLASQGLTVVISAVAMYDEVRDWVKSNLPRSLEVYLNVPTDERRRRDQQVGKHLYQDNNNTTKYDEPTHPDLEIANYGSKTPDDAADEILDVYLNSDTQHTREDRLLEHWRSYYTIDGGVLEPSPFALYVTSQMKRPLRLLEVGCGNGRDAAFFARQGHDVIACDISEEAIALCHERHGHLPITFVQGRLADLTYHLHGPFDAIYTRFCFHAIPEQEELDILDTASQLARVGSNLFVECRSINDPLARKGEVLSPNERIYGHYRRFLRPYALSDRIEAAGFSVTELVESNGFAPFGEEDPLIIRLVAQRSGF